MRLASVISGRGALNRTALLTASLRETFPVFTSQPILTSSSFSQSHFQLFAHTLYNQPLIHLGTLHQTTLSNPLITSSTELWGTDIPQAPDCLAYSSNHHSPSPRRSNLLPWSGPPITSNSTQNVRHYRDPREEARQVQQLAPWSRFESVRFESSTPLLLSQLTACRFEVTTLGQPLEVTKTTMAANRGVSFAGALGHIWGRGGVLGCQYTLHNLGQSEL